MTEDELARETEKAAAANDGARLRELNKLERRNEIQSESPKYLDSSDGDGAESGVVKRAERALSMAEAMGQDDLARALEAVSTAEEPEKILRQELAVAKDRNPEAVDVLRELQADE